MSKIYNAVFFFAYYLLGNRPEMGAHMIMHGDGVKDVAFSVDDCRSLYKVSQSDTIKLISKVLFSFVYFDLTIVYIALVSLYVNGYLLHCNSGMIQTLLIDSVQMYSNSM